jgi:carbonic anhydrase
MICRLRDSSGTAVIEPARFFSFADVEEDRREQIQKVKAHPSISKEIPVRGVVFDVDTGRMKEVAA